MVKQKTAVSPPSYAVVGLTAQVKHSTMTVGDVNSYLDLHVSIAGRLGVRGRWVNGARGLQLSDHELVAP